MFVFAVLALEAGCVVLLNGPFKQGESNTVHLGLNFTCLLYKPNVGLGLILVT